MRMIVSCILVLLSFMAFCYKCSTSSLRKNSNSSEITSSVYSNDPFGSRIYNHFTPNQFLDHLTKFKIERKGLYFVVYAESPADWIKSADIDTLIFRVFDTTKVPCVVNPLSSYLPTNSNSCIGREAQNMITSYIDKKGYLNFLYSCGSVDSLKAKKLMDWYQIKLTVANEKGMH